MTTFIIPLAKPSLLGTTSLPELPSYFKKIFAKWTMLEGPGWHFSFLHD
jgi:hypothetical protein